MFTDANHKRTKASMHMKEKTSFGTSTKASKSCLKGVSIHMLTRLLGAATISIRMIILLYNHKATAFGKYISLVNLHKCAVNLLRPHSLSRDWYLGAHRTVILEAGREEVAKSLLKESQKRRL